jgi:hypothetical protein
VDPTNDAPSLVPSLTQCGAIEFEVKAKHCTGSLPAISRRPSSYCAVLALLNTAGCPSSHFSELVMYVTETRKRKFDGILDSIKDHSAVQHHHCSLKR